MLYEWDENKNRTNKAKHGISFEAATRIWRDTSMVVVADQVLDFEERWMAIGWTGSDNILVAIHTYRDHNRQEIVRIISARKLRRMSADDINKEMSAEIEAELKALAEMPDEMIDFSDIPEITDEQWATARRASHFRPLKSAITIRLDNDVLAWFRKMAEGGKYQSEINRVLRAHMEAASKKSA